MKYHLFISHKTQDYSIANTLKYALVTLSQNQLEIHLSQDMVFVGGKERHFDNLLRSEVLIFINTVTPLIEGERSLDQCKFEIGMFYGNKISTGKGKETESEMDKKEFGLFVIKQHSDLDSLIPFLEYIQTVDADKDGIRILFKNLIFERYVFLPDPLVSKVDTHQFEEMVNQVISSFKPQVKFTRSSQNLLLFNTSEMEDRGIKEYDFNNIKIFPEYDAMSLLDLPEDGATWHMLYSDFQERGQSTWLDQIGECIERIKQRRSCITTLQPFTTQEGKVFIPIISGVETFHLKENEADRVIPKRIEVIIVPIPKNYAKATDKQFKDVTEELGSAKKKILKLEQMAIVEPHWGSGDLPIEKDLCFLLMPFSEPWSDNVWKLIAGVVRDCGYRCERADEKDGRVVMEDIWSGICRAQYVIADLSGKNPNVTYEVGLADVLGKKVILLSQTPKDVPFDFLGLRLIPYEDSIGGVQKLSEELRRRLGKNEVDNKTKIPLGK